MENIDYSKIGKIINNVVIKLNNYMVDCPEIILDLSKQKNLLNSNGDINNLYKINLGVYYSSMLVWYCSNENAANGIVSYCNKYCSIVSDDMLKNLEKLNIKSKFNPEDTTKVIMDLAITNTYTKIKNTKNMNVGELIKAITIDLLKEKFNQKPTEYNLTLIQESFKKVNLVVKGEI